MYTNNTAQLTKKWQERKLNVEKQRKFLIDQAAKFDYKLPEQVTPDEVNVNKNDLENVNFETRFNQFSDKVKRLKDNQNKISNLNLIQATTQKSKSNSNSSKSLSSNSSEEEQKYEEDSDDGDSVRLDGSLRQNEPEIDDFDDLESPEEEEEFDEKKKQEENSEEEEENHSARTHEHAIYNGAYLKATYDWYQLIRRNKSKFDNCRLSDFIQDLKVVAKKTSASESVIMLGKVLPPSSVDLSNLTDKDKTKFGNVAIKVSYPSDILSNQLRVEREIIQQAFSIIIKNCYTPNVVTYVNAATCDNDSKFNFPSETIKGNFLNAKIKLKLTNKTKASYIIMEKGDESLAEVINTDMSFMEHDFIAVLVQAYYTLECFARMNIRHNDLHAGNMMIKILSQPEDFFFEIPTQSQQSQTRIIKFSTRYILKMFDMDNGSAFFKHVERNLNLDSNLCYEHGMCNLPDIKFDVAGFNFIIRNLAGNSEEDELEKVGQYIEEKILGSDIYQKYKPRPLTDKNGRVIKNNKGKDLMYNDHPQAWFSLAKDDIDTINRTKTPLQCLNTIINDYDQIITQATPQEVEKYLFQVFHLPNKEDYMLHFGNPNIHMMWNNGVLEYKDAKDVKMNNFNAKTSIEPSTPKQLLERFNFFDKTDWSETLIEWLRELNLITINNQKYDWLQTALILSDNFSQFERPVSFQLACLLLACPMFYGITNLARSSLRKALENYFNLEELSIVSNEKIIWNWRQFQGTLPIQMPLLYDESDDDTDNNDNGRQQLPKTQNNMNNINNNNNENNTHQQQQENPQQGWFSKMGNTMYNLGQKILPGK